MNYRKNGRTYREVYFVGCKKCDFYKKPQDCLDAPCVYKFAGWKETWLSKFINKRMKK